MDMRLLVIPLVIIVLAAAALIVSQPAPVAPPAAQPPVAPPVTPPTQPPAAQPNATEQPYAPPASGANVTGEIAVTILSIPATAESGRPFTVSWRVEGANTTMPHTSVHYDYAPHPGTFGTDVTPAASGYPYLIKDFAKGNFTIPNTFTANITPNATGTLYYRGHAIVGGKNYWTGERTMAITAPAPQAQLRQYAFEADDYGYYYANGTAVSSITVNKGDTVDLTLTVRTTNVYHGGLGFEGCIPKVEQVTPGSSHEVQFNATITCSITSSWPYTYTTKKDLRIMVQ